MPWWVWLVVGWTALAVIGAVLIGRGVRHAEHRDWRRRGSPERRDRPRTPDTRPAVRRRSDAA